MLCTSCRRTLLSRLSSCRTQIRTVATVPSTPNAAPSQPPPSTTPSTSARTPAQSSSVPGVSQPLSTPFFPSTSTAKLPPKPTSKASKLRGSIPGGGELKGIAYLKNKPSVLAKEDDEYPSWLWSLLDESKLGTGEVKVDLGCMFPFSSHTEYLQHSHSSKHPTNSSF